MRYHVLAAVLSLATIGSATVLVMLPTDGVSEAPRADDERSAIDRGDPWRRGVASDGRRVRRDAGAAVLGR